MAVVESSFIKLFQNLDTLITEGKLALNLLFLQKY